MGGRRAKGAMLARLAALGSSAISTGPPILAALRSGMGGLLEHPAHQYAIRSSVVPGVPAILLANHGVLVFHRTPDLKREVDDIMVDVIRSAAHLNKA